MQIEIRYSEKKLKTLALLTILSCLAAGFAFDSGDSPIALSPEHLEAVNRKRRVAVNFDAITADGARFATKDVQELVAWKLMFADEAGSHIDSVWWSWGEGNQAPYPSKILPGYDTSGFKGWAESGIDIVRIFLEACKKRDLETFISHRMNASDADLGKHAKIPMKEAHPDWLLHPFPGHPTLGEVVFWNYAIRGVRDHKLNVLREVAGNYDFDGMELDFSRRPLCLPIGHQWENRHHLTEFIRQVRLMLLEIERQRGSPFLLAVRVGENLVGCHYDGMDVEAWVRERLVDILALGSRSFEVDIESFRRITEGTHIKLYPCLDDHHATDGYQWPPIEVLRGVFANWWHQGTDGIETFNWGHGTGEAAARIGMYLEGGWPVHRQAYQEMGEPNLLRRKDKVFVVQRRGGGGWGGPDPDAWHTPRQWYLCTNMFAQLPARLDIHGKVDTLLEIYVADDLGAEDRHVKEVSVRLLLHNPGGGGYITVNDSLPPPPPDSHTIERGLLAVFGGVDYRYNSPPAKSVEDRLAVRLNNIPLGRPAVEAGWFVFHDVDPRLFAVGRNLLGVLVKKPGFSSDQRLLIEKLEVHVRYK
jgi:hypothetical protein